MMLHGGDTVARRMIVPEYPRRVGFLQQADAFGETVAQGMRVAGGRTHGQLRTRHFLAQSAPDIFAHKIKFGPHCAIKQLAHPCDFFFHDLSVLIRNFLSGVSYGAIFLTAPEITEPRIPYVPQRLVRPLPDRKRGMLLEFIHDGYDPFLTRLGIAAAYVKFHAEGQPGIGARRRDTVQRGCVARSANQIEPGLDRVPQDVVLLRQLVKPHKKNGVAVQRDPAILEHSRSGPARRCGHGGDNADTYTKAEICAVTHDVHTPSCWCFLNGLTSDYERRSRRLSFIKRFH